MNDELNEYRTRFWPRACFPARATEAQIFNFVLWKYIAIKRAQWAAERRALRPSLRLRLAVRARWCARGLRLVGRLLRLMMIFEGSWPTRARWKRWRR